MERGLVTRSDAQCSTAGRRIVVSWPHAFGCRPHPVRRRQHTSLLAALDVGDRQGLVAAEILAEGVAEDRERRARRVRIVRSEALMSIDPKAVTLELDMERLLRGLAPQKAVLDKAPFLNWWQPRRCKGAGIQGAD